MSDRIPIPTDELAVHFSVHLAVIGQKSPWVIRELLNPKIGPRDQVKIERARKELAAQLAATFDRAKWEVTRPPDEIQWGR